MRYLIENDKKKIIIFIINNIHQMKNLNNNLNN